MNMQILVSIKKTSVRSGGISVALLALLFSPTTSIGALEITGIDPPEAIIGGTVTLEGEGLNEVVNIFLSSRLDNLIPSPDFEIISDERLRFVVPPLKLYNDDLLPIITVVSETEATIVFPEDFIEVTSTLVVEGHTEDYYLIRSGASYSGSGKAIYMESDSTVTTFGAKLIFAENGAVLRFLIGGGSSTAITEPMVIVQNAITAEVLVTENLSPSFVPQLLTILETPEILLFLDPKNPIVRGFVDTPFLYPISLNTGPPKPGEDPGITYSAKGFPEGLAVDANSGLITGTPVETGIFTVTLIATNENGPGSATLIFDIRPPYVWTGAIPFDNDWKFVSWFGFLNDKEYPWIFHLGLGWMFNVGENSDSIWSWTKNLEWIWTNEETYPFIYRDEDKTWLFFLEDSEPNLFFNFTTNLWEEGGGGDVP